MAADAGQTKIFDIARRVARAESEFLDRRVERSRVAHRERRHEVGRIRTLAMRGTPGAGVARMSLPPDAHDDLGPARLSRRTSLP
jgi:hypothetical protein